jgi:hypothetical protein
MFRKLYFILLLILGMFVQASPAPLQAMDLEPTGLVPAALPAGNVTVSPVTQADLDADGGTESLALTSGRLSILSDRSGTVWQSPQAWDVLQAAITDLNSDGKPEVTLLLWRPFKPWPVDQWLPNGGRIAGFHDAAAQSCHIILIGWRRDGYGEVWAGSAMAEPITSFTATDLDGDNLQELVALESRYTDTRSAPARILKIWEWNGFGFTVVSSLDGWFEKLVLIRASNDHILILVP